VLEECIDLQKRKSQDYQNPNSNIVQAMHYRRGVSTIHDMVAQKLLRAQSLLEAYENGGTETPNFESLEDTYKDAINYLSFAVSYIRGKMEGQDPNRDMLNRKVTTYTSKPAGGGTGTGVEITKEEFNELLKGEHVHFTNEDTTGGSASGQAEVEADGFITVFPALLGADSDVSAKIPLGEGDGSTPDSRIKGAYLKRVLPRGEIKVPRGETICSDNVAITYDELKGSKKSKR
jgi:hypothetical protein